MHFIQTVATPWLLHMSMCTSTSPGSAEAASPLVHLCSVLVMHGQVNGAHGTSPYLFCVSPTGFTSGVSIPDVSVHAHIFGAVFQPLPYAGVGPAGTHPLGCRLSADTRYRLGCPPGAHYHHQEGLHHLCAGWSDLPLALSCDLFLQHACFCFHAPYISCKPPPCYAASTPPAGPCWHVGSPL